MEKLNKHNEISGNKKIRGFIKKILREYDAEKYGIATSSKKRKQEQFHFHLNVLLREGKFKTSMRGNMRVGRKEMVCEISPSKKNIGTYKARIVRGEQVKDLFQDILCETFKEVKNTGVFQQSIPLGVRRLIKNYIEKINLLQNNPRLQSSVNNLSNSQATSAD